MLYYGIVQIPRFIGVFFAPLCILIKWHYLCNIDFYFFMPPSGPIIIIEDDLDDQELIQHAFKEIGVDRKLVFFANAHEAFDFLKATPEQPFLILSDVNLPGQNGIEFKRQIDNDPYLRQKSTPFVFFSTAVDKKEIDIAYREMTVQGFFPKGNNYADMKKVLHVIMEYWKISRHPNR